MNHKRQDRTTKGAFSRPIDVDDVPGDGLEVRIEATPDERATIAKEAGLPAVGSLVANYEIERRPAGRLEVHGELRARITQDCVVSLEPFESDKVQAISLTFAPEVPSSPARGHSRRRAAHGPNGAPAAVFTAGHDQEDPPDPIIDGTIDLGAVALEFLTLAQDLYPRRPGVQFTDVVAGDMPEEIPSAFAALARLKDRL